MVGARVASADDGTVVAELRRLARSELLEQRGGEQFTAAEMAGPSVDVAPSTPDGAASRLITPHVTGAGLNGTSASVGGVCVLSA